ncbi:protein phosphatase 2C domain-containing protein [Terrisporobacter glycolicus]|uniref:PPM-type phosphatase domain-containing protein n=1 Tax=Terrisporobacter glycolicus ATCC 14880 = DSM 1288 TaxID=1121315 RepID=A0ABZ2EX69_9FIRM|nr:protein phosphatase 2C domain-containing protein [Terrisporobacter glycolicus]
MKFSVFSKSVVGYKNIIKNKSSQDYLQFDYINDGLICAVADGHSGDFFTYSHLGSKFACEVAIETLKKYADEDIGKIKTLFDNKILQKEICNGWKVLVEQDIKNRLPRAFKYNYFIYGTTLLGVMIKKDYIIYLKIGDGDIIIKQDDNFKKVLPSYNKNIVDCLAEDKAYDKMIYKVVINEININNIIIYSDGFENSFSSYKSMLNNIDSTLIMYNKNIFSKTKLEKNYHKELSDLSKSGSLDDISIIFVNILL